MSKEPTPNPDNLTLAGLERFQELAFVSIGVEAKTGYSYDIGFIFDHPSGQHIRVRTESRSDYLSKGTEQQAQDALVDLAQQIRQRSGGYFSIHPFYGAVWGTKLTPVAPGFLTDLEEPDGSLTMIIYLTSSGAQFDEKLTKKSLALGTVVAIPGPKAESFFDYMDAAPKANPNQFNRDQAIVNRLGKRWDGEFGLYHQISGTNQVMELTSTSISGLIRSLENEAGLTGSEVTRITPKD